MGFDTRNQNEKIYRTKDPYGPTTVVHLDLCEALVPHFR
jgi:hypothetical protein